MILIYRSINIGPGIRPRCANERICFPALGLAEFVQLSATYPWLIFKLCFGNRTTRLTFHILLSHILFFRPEGKAAYLQALYAMQDT